MTNINPHLQSSATSDIQRIAELSVPHLSGFECQRHSAVSPVIKSSHGGSRPGAGRKPKFKPQPTYEADRARWFCVRTTYDGEVTADMALRAAGFTTFLPLLWVAPKPARRTELGRSVPAQSERLVPLFARYTFVQFLRSNPSWRRIATMRGVESVFSTSPENPTAVPDKAIEAIRSQCMPNGVVYPPEHRAEPLATGSVVRVTDGAMTGFEGICEASDGERVRVLLNLFGRATPVTMLQSGVSVA